MSPVSAFLNPMYGADANAIRFGYEGKGFAWEKVFDFPNILLTELGRVVGRTLLSCHWAGSPQMTGVGIASAVAFPAPLRHHVGHIVGNRSQKEVVGVDASRGIAGMTDKHSAWVALVQRIKDSVSKHFLAIDIQGAVATPIVKSALPQPATSFFINSIIHVHSVPEWEEKI